MKKQILTLALLLGSHVQVSRGFYKGCRGTVQFRTEGIFLDTYFVRFRCKGIPDDLGVPTSSEGRDDFSPYALEEIYGPAF